jgi:hypothetical protein
MIRSKCVNFQLIEEFCRDFQFRPEDFLQKVFRFGSPEILFWELFSGGLIGRRLKSISVGFVDERRQRLAGFVGCAGRGRQSDQPTQRHKCDKQHPGLEVGKGTSHCEANTFGLQRLPPV